MNPSYKPIVDRNIAACFKTRIANYECRIAEIKTNFAKADQEYKRLISEDLAIDTKATPEAIASRYESLTTELRRYQEELKDINEAYCKWKSIANYAD